MWNFFQSTRKPTIFTLEDMQMALQTPNKYIIINTLSYEYQDCIIPGTISSEREESIINEMITDIHQADKPILIYGKNSCDETPEKKRKQLQSLGLSEIYIYSGGMFEWLLLNEIYGSSEFPITNTNTNTNTNAKKPTDIWKYRPKRNEF